MSKILMTVWPIETHLSPFIALARALAERGHSVGFYISNRVQGQLKREGFRCFPFQAEVNRHTECNPGAAASQRMSVWARRKMWHDFLLGSVPGQLRDLDRIWAVWQPDVVVCDVTMWGPILVLHEEKRVPLAIFSHAGYCLLPGRDNPAPGISMPRPRTSVGRFIARLLSSGINLATLSIPREASRIRKEHGLAPLDTTVVEFTGRMPLHLVPSAPEFDYDRDDLPPSVRYVGPCFAEIEQHTAPAWVTQLRTRQRIVVLEELHQPEDAFLLETAAKAFAGHPAEVVLVAGRGRELPVFDPRAVAPNVRLERWTPLSYAISSADLVIAHGNSETVLASVSRGIPMVVVPRILEQPQIAWRLSASGAGIRLPMSRCTPERLRSAAERVLNSSAFPRNARRISAAFERRGGPVRAAELVEGLDRNGRLTRGLTA
jgi:MGT family glycosyltransferase